MPCNNPLGGALFLQPPYPQIQGPMFGNTISIAMKRHLMDRNNENTESETLEPNGSCMRSDDGSELKEQLSQGQEQWRKAGQSCKKKSGVVFISNITYISSERKHGSTLARESDKEVNDVWSGQKHNQKHSVGSGKRKEIYTRPAATGNSYDNKETANYSDVVNTGNWQVFQNILLQHDNNDRHADHGMSAQEEDILLNGQQNRTGTDPIVHHGQDSFEVQDRTKSDYHTNSGKKTHLLSASNNELVSAPGELGRGSNDCLVDLHFKEIESGKGGYEKAVNDGFIIYGQKTSPEYQFSSSDPLVECGLADANRNLCNNSLSNVIEESFMLPQRSGSPNKSKADCSIVDIDAELHSAIPVNENGISSVRRQLSYEPDDLTLLQNGIVKELIGYDPAVDYETQFFGRSNVTDQNIIKEDYAFGVEEISKKLDKDIKARALHENAVMKKNGKASKLIPLTEVHDRAERTRSSKIDLQKMKKTKEDEEIKRLEALKREREKRIAARSSSGPAHLIPKISPTSYKGSNFSDPEPHRFSPLQSLPNRTASLGSNFSQKITGYTNLNKISPSQSTVSSQMRLQPQSKLSPVSYKGSKFSDSEPGPSSPLQRLRSRAASLKSNASQKITGVGLNGNNQYASHKSIWSALPEPKNVNALVTPERKVSASQICKLPDPKRRNMDHVSSANLDTPTAPETKVDAAGVPRLSKPKTSNRHHISPTKLRTPYSLTKLKEADGYRFESISKSQISRDKSQVAVHPDLKSKLLKRPSDIVQNKAIELSLKRNCGSPVTVEAMQVQESNEEPLYNRNGEDKQVIETTVVLENETSVIPLIEVDWEDGENTGLITKDVAIPATTSPVDTRKESNKHEDGENAGITRDAGIPATTSPVATKEVGDSSTFCFEKNLYSHKVTADYDVKELPKGSSTSISAAPYQTTFAAVSSLEDEDPCITNLEFTTVPPSASEMEEIIVETTEMPVSYFTDSTRFEKTQGSMCKPQVKVISKGISRMFKFGRTRRKPNVRSNRLTNKGAMVNNSLASTASSNKVKKSEQGRFRETMSYALYIA